MKELVYSVLGKEKIMNINNKHIWNYVESGRQMEAPEYFFFFLFSPVALFLNLNLRHRIGNSWFRLKVSSSH